MGPLRTSLLIGFFKACQRWHWLPPSSGPGYIYFHCSLTSTDVTPGSLNPLNQVSPPQSRLHPYICKGIHFTDRGKSLVVTYTESHTMQVYLPYLENCCNQFAQNKIHHRTVDIQVKSSSTNKNVSFLFLFFLFASFQTSC